MKYYTVIIVLILIIMLLLFALTGCLNGYSPIPKDEEPGARRVYTSKNAPSVIESTDITDFECDFFGGIYGMSYDHCHFTAKKETDTISCVAEGTTWDDAPFHVEFTADYAMFTDLQTIVSDNELVKNNGFYGHTNGLPYGIGGSLSIKYASGEELTMSDNSCAPFPCVQFCKLFEQYAEEAGYLFIVDEKLYVPENWADALSGWWVYLGEDADVQNPEMYMFTDDNKYYISPEFFTRTYSEEEYDFHGEWILKDGKPIRLAHPDIEEYISECRIFLTDEAHMIFIDYECREIRKFVKSSAPEAIAFLEQSPYYYLADYGPNLCYVRLGEYIGKGDFYIERKNVVLVKNDDYELIKEHGLENAPFEKGYELILPSDKWYSVCQIDGETKYSVVDTESDNPASTLKTVTSEEFAGILRERGEMLAYVREEEALILTLEEFFDS